MLNSIFYIILTVILGKILLEAYVLSEHHTMSFYLLQTLLITLWLAPLIWKYTHKILPKMKRHSGIYLWCSPLVGWLLINLWFLAPFQSVANHNLSGSLLALCATLLGGWLIWMPLTSHYLSWFQQALYLFVITLLQSPLVLYLSMAPDTLSGLGGIDVGFMLLSPLEEQQFAAVIYQIFWLAQLLVLGSQLFCKGHQERELQDRLQNQLHLENHYLAQQAPRRLG